MSQQNQAQVQLRGYESIEEVPTPYDQRGCTDVFCIVIGVTFSLIMILISVIGYNNQLYIQSNFPADSDGVLCGIDAKGYPYVYFANPPELAKRVCVAKCPQEDDKKLECNPTSNVGCRFSQTPGFQVNYYESDAVQTRNGLFCYPKDDQLRQKLLQNTNLLHRDNFMRSLDVVFICMAIALGTSILYMIIVQFLPTQMNYAAVVAGTIAMVVLIVCCLFYPTQYTAAKWICIAIFLFLVLITAVEVLFHRNAWKIHGIFLKEATKMVSNRWQVVLYIPLFLAIAVAFAFILVYEFKSIWTHGHLEFDAQKSLYHILKGFWPHFLTVLWAIQAIWGMTFIKESFNFCVSGTAVLWYHSENVDGSRDDQGFFYPLKLLVMKHFGSVIGGSFMTGFFSIGDYFFDFLRPNQQENPNGCYTKFFYTAFFSCFKVFELVRSDAMSYINLAGNPYCNSARYCEYLCDHSLLMDNSQSTSRAYRICAHFLIAAFISVLGLYLKGVGISLYIIGIIILLTIFISTFFISLHADAAEAIQIIFLEHEEFTKRHGLNEDKTFKTSNLQSAFGVNKKRQLAEQLKDMRKSQMQLEQRAKRESQVNS